MRRISGWSLIGVVCMLAVASAQVRPNPRPAPGAVPPAAGAAPAANVQGTADQQMAACLWSNARNEVELGKFAEGRAKSDEVREFAAQMIKDHSQQQDKLASIAGNLVTAGTARGGLNVEIRREVRKVPAEEGREERREGRDEAREKGDREERREGREGARDERRDARDERTVTTTIARGQAFSWVAVHREMADQCLQTAKKELGSKEGNEFDQCYIGMQVGAHLHMLDAIKVFKNHATGELQQEIEQSIDTTESHLKDARKIMESLKQNK